jgi:hypothetical protein
MRIVLYVACRFVATSLNAQKLQDFSGTWHINPDKVVSKIYLPKTPPDSAPPIQPPPPDQEYTLEQMRLSGNILKIAGGEAGTTAVYTIDPSGKKVSDPIPDAPGQYAYRDHPLARWKTGHGMENAEKRRRVHAGNRHA